MKKMDKFGKKIEFVNIESLRLYSSNAKQHPDTQIELIKRSMKEFGWTVPVLVDGERGVIAGHGRIEAAKALGIEEVPVIFLDYLTPAQARAYRIADNKLTELGDWDEGLLVEEFKALREMNFDLELTGFDKLEVQSLLRKADNEAAPDHENFDTGDRQLLLVEFETEDACAQLFEELQQRGYECKIMN